MGDDAARLTAWAEVVASRLASGGVRHVVVSPGSRSTAFVLAAHRHPDLTLHDVVDERAAAFVALGMARATGVPAALLTTSGTAPAHAYPAVIEATRARVPLIILSADRPPELIGCEAPQAIDQVKLFGDHVVHFADLGPPASAPAALRGAARAVSQAVAASTGPVPGAVHLNLRARKPFEPEAPATAAGRASQHLAEQLCQQPPAVFLPERRASQAGLEAVASRLASARSGLILAGPAPVAAAGRREAVVALARATGFPVYAEATSQLRWWARPADVFWWDTLDLAAHALTEAPEVVLELGQPVVAGSHGRALAALGAERVVLSDGPWADWQGTAGTFVFGDLSDALPRLAECAEAHVKGRGAPASPPSWAALAQATRDQVDAAVARGQDTELAAVHALARHVPAGTQWMIGNSLAVRAIDWFARPERHAVVLHQRGANGIDGTIAGAVGSARATGTPTVVLLGDVTARHDLTSLALASGSDTPVVVVVLHNGGGRIFDLLPVATHPAVTEAQRQHLTTPDARGFRGVAELFGVSHQVVTPADLGPAVEVALTTAGATLLEVPVAPHGTATWVKRIRAALQP